MTRLIPIDPKEVEDDDDEFDGNAVVAVVLVNDHMTLALDEYGGLILHLLDDDGETIVMGLGDARTTLNELVAATPHLQRQFN